MMNAPDSTLPEKTAQMHAGHWDKSAAGSHEVRGRKLGISKQLGHYIIHTIAIAGNRFAHVERPPDSVLYSPGVDVRFGLPTVA